LSSKDARNRQASELRQRAEAVVQEESTPAEDGGAPSRMESLANLRELHLCQVELGLQADDLDRTQVELESCRGRYPGISDHDPVGYCTLSEQGTILECNHILAALLGENQGSMISQQFTHYIGRDDQDLYYLNRKKFLESGLSEVCELRMRRTGGGTFRVHLKTFSAQDAASRQVSLVVITSLHTLDQTMREGSKLHAHVDSGHGGAPGGTPWTSGPGLSEREREVLYLVGRGQTSRAIAEALEVSSRTVDSHRQKIMQKLEICNAAGLVKFAIEHGLESPTRR